MGLQLAIYDGPAGALIADYSHIARSLRFSTGEHGYRACSFDVPLSLSEAFRLYDRPGLPHVEVNWGAGRVWEGRLEDPSISDLGANLQALGYWRALSDAPYTALWSDTGVAEWRPITVNDQAGNVPERYEIDTNNRLYIAPRKGETFANNADVGSLTYETPVGGSRQIVAVSFDYQLLAPANWIGRFDTFARDFSGNVAVWTLAATGVLQSGSQSLTFTAADRIGFRLYNNTGGPVTLAADSGVTFLRITNLRVKTTTSASVYADEIARDLVATVAALNSSQLSSATGLIQSPALDLRDEVYEDEYPADILTRLARLGDSSTPPRRWETGVYDGRVLHFRPLGDAARAWYVDAASLRLERSLDQLRNSAYAVYQDSSGTTQRGSVSTDAASVSRYGVTRREAVHAQTTSLTQANVQRDAALQDKKDPKPRAAITFGELYDAAGSRYPLFLARAGDTITMRNLPPTLSVEVDRIRTFRISETEYSADTDTLQVTPESPLPSLEVLLARRQERL